MNASLFRRTAAPAAASVGAVRNLNVHEYISMEIMQSHGIKTPECFVANNPEEAEHIFLNSLNKRKSIPIRSTRSSEFEIVRTMSRCLSRWIPACDLWSSYNSE